tara:strand:- start:1608 stop:2579 length:972 start_codon:yes stop_codon:yes gene_type:complete
MKHLCGKSLVSARAVATDWMTQAEVAAELLVRRSMRSLPPESGCILCWPRALAALDAFQRKVGPKPERSWWQEWPQLRLAETKLAGSLCESDDIFKRGGGGSCAQALRKYSTCISWMVAAGWTTPHAVACLLLGAGGTEALGHALRSGSCQHAASAHALWEALAVRAAQLTLARPGWSAPPTYACLGGRFGLMASDPVWANLLLADAKPGMSFVTSSLVQATSEPISTCDGSGALGFGVCVQGAAHAGFVHVTMGAEVVVFLSTSSSSAGHNSLLLSSPQGYHLPPMARITLEDVEYTHSPILQMPASTSPARRFVVSVSYAL